MRRIYDPITGSDVTATVQTILQSGRSLVTTNLYMFRTFVFWNYNPYGSLGNFVYTDGTFPIFVNMIQQTAGPATQLGHWLHELVMPSGETFLPEKITFDKLSYGIGFENKNTEVTWWVDDTKDYKLVEETSLGGVGKTGPSEVISPVNFTMKKALSLGIFQDCPFWIHQAIFTDFPYNGGTFLGTTLMFRGYIRKVTATRSSVKLSLSSLMEIFQTVQVPTQTITPNNRSLPYIPTSIGTYGLDFGVPPTVVGETVLSFSTAESIPANALQDYWLVFAPATYAGPGFSPFHSGQPASPAFRIARNDAPSGGFVTVYFYEAVAVPVTPATVAVYAPLATDSTVGQPGQGFKYLPPPEMSA